LGIRSIFERWSGKKNDRKIRIGDYQLQLDLRWKHEASYLKWASKQRLNGPIAFDTLAIEHFIKPGDVVLDAGANIGFTALYFLKCGAREVHAFEPDPRNFRRLAQLQTRGRVITYPEALGSEDGEVEFVISRSHNQGSTFDQRMLEKFPEVFAGGEHIKVRVYTLISRLPDVHFDFMKIDVEGAEAALLTGAQTILESHPPRVFLIECYDEMFDEVLDILAGYYRHHCRLLYHKSTGKLLSVTTGSTIQRNDCFSSPPTYIYTTEPGRLGSLSSA
jgi:FkbM family methyltransferase